ncbi:MAG: hypothetical protein R3305_01915, partial [Gammaproteobacteria bacterium]|nr:hypothetical protein [Gammaproteobacteria bacterium]
MQQVFLQLTPIFFFFAIGVALRRFGLADRSHGDFVLRLVFFVTLPLLILITISNAALTAEKALLPLANIVVNFLCLGALLIAMKGRNLPR